MPDLLWRPEAAIMERLEFSTEIIQGRDGYEQRIAHRGIPLPTYALDLRVDDRPEVRRLRQHFFRSMNAVWRFPRWWEGTAITSEVSASGQTWPMDMTYNDLAVGDKIYVERLIAGTGEVFTVDQVNAGDVHTIAGATAAFPAGSVVYKLESGKLVDDQQFGRDMQGYDRWAIQMNIDPPPALGGGGASLSTHQQTADAAAYTLLDREPLGPEDISGTFFGNMTRVVGISRISQFDIDDPARIIESRRYLINTRAELQYWELFVSTVNGMQKPFYTPTFRHDLSVVTQPTGPSWNTVVVADESADPTDTLDYAGQYDGFSSHQSLWFETDQGDQAREVTSAVDNADGTVTLTLASGLTASSVISKVSFLERSRLASDEVIFTHYRNQRQSIIELMMTTVQRHPDE